ncbi:MAG: SpoIID/LytB domain-containing protein [bacterium]
MKHKIFIFVISCLIFILINLIFSQQNSAPTLKAEPFNSINDNIIRVGISTNDFNRLEYDEVSISSDFSFELVDKSTGLSIVKSNGKDIFTVKISKSDFKIFNKNKQIAENITGPISAKSFNNSPVQIVGLVREGKPAYYRGEIEIVKAPGKKDKLSAVNILPLEDYLKGVVPNELPPAFGLEALKAQAVAARNYALKPRIKSYSQFDICDSVQCQVYFGYNTENHLANKAIEETKGLVALYKGDIILALYSSTAGGYTENYENAFSDPQTGNFPASPLKYLKGKPDVEGTPALNNEESAKNFYSSFLPGFDINSGYYRWTKTWTREELESTLNKNLSKYSDSEFICPKFKKYSDIGTLYKINVLSRGVSGKAMVVEITASNGTWLVKKELLIRRIFENTNKILPSANVIFDNQFDSNGNLVKIDAFGGGFGHGVGMSQYGAGYLSKNGYSFDKILQHYYDNVTIGTTPVFFNSKDSFYPIKQDFLSPNGKADLVLNKYLNNFKIIINSNEVDISDLDKEKLRINLDKYVKKGENEIIYYPNNKNNEDIKAWIEVYT